MNLLPTDKSESQRLIICAIVARGRALSLLKNEVAIAYRASLSHPSQRGGRIRHWFVEPQRALPQALRPALPAGQSVFVRESARRERRASARHLARIRRSRTGVRAHVCGLRGVVVRLVHPGGARLRFLRAFGYAARLRASEPARSYALSRRSRFMGRSQTARNEDGKEDGVEKRFGKDPFTGQERWFDAKPATVKLKIRALKKLKDAAAT